MRKYININKWEEGWFLTILKFQNECYLVSLMFLSDLEFNNFSQHTCVSHFQ